MDFQAPINHPCEKKKKKTVFLDQLFSFKILLLENTFRKAVFITNINMMFREKSPDNWEVIHPNMNTWVF